LFLYDTYPGGIGHSEPLFRMHERLIEGALALLRSCACSGGCPSCVGPLGEVGEHGKHHAELMLKALAAGKESNARQERAASAQLHNT
jgi:DEAD/DEAH box helicase domain-containing protein